MLAKSLELLSIISFLPYLAQLFPVGLVARKRWGNLLEDTLPWKRGLQHPEAQGKGRLPYKSKEGVCRANTWEHHPDSAITCSRASDFSSLGPDLSQQTCLDWYFIHLWSSAILALRSCLPLNKVYSSTATDKDFSINYQRCTGPYIFSTVC